MSARAGRIPSGDFGQPLVPGWMMFTKYINRAIRLLGPRLPSVSPRGERRKASQQAGTKGFDKKHRLKKNKKIIRLPPIYFLIRKALRDNNWSPAKASFSLGHSKGWITLYLMRHPKLREKCKIEREKIKAEKKTLLQNTLKNMRSALKGTYYEILKVSFDATPILLRSSSEAGFLTTSNAPINSFVSSTNRKFLIPQFFPYFTHSFNSFLQANATEWRCCCFGQFPSFFKSLFSFQNFFLHLINPLIITIPFLNRGVKFIATISTIHFHHQNFPNPTGEYFPEMKPRFNADWLDNPIDISAHIPCGTFSFAHNNRGFINRIPPPRKIKTATLVGAEIRRLRKEKNMSQKELIQKAGISKRIIEIEQGRGILSVDFLRKVAKGLEASFNLLNALRVKDILDKKIKTRDIPPLAQKIIELRELKCMEQKELAEKSGIDLEYLSLIETGRAKNIGYKILIKIARALGIKPEVLIEFRRYKKNVQGGYGKFFGEKLQNMREEKGMSQAEFAQKFGITQGYLANIEIGRRMPGYKLFYEMVKALGVDINLLYPWWTQIIYVGDLYPFVNPCRVTPEKILLDKEQSILLFINQLPLAEEAIIKRLLEGADEEDFTTEERVVYERALEKLRSMLEE